MRTETMKILIREFLETHTLSELVFLVYDVTRDLENNKSI